jgi:hypothetical protein
MNRPSHEALLAVILPALGVYFAALLLRGLLGYRRFRRLRATALLTWPGPPPARFDLLPLLGAAAAGVALLNGVMRRPLLHVLAQALMALYFVVMVPLARRIRLGVYRDGVWADAGFLPWREIRRLSFRETPELVLVLLPRRGARSFRLPVPAGEYGHLRKILDQMVRARALQLEPGIPGL